jgi:hypothetical protein
MSRRIATVAAAAGLAAFLLAGLAASASAATGPLYRIKATWGDTYLTPGDASAATSEAEFVVQARNVGDATGASDLTITDALPTGLTITDLTWDEGATDYTANCTGVGTSLASCTMPAAKLSQTASAPGDGPGTISPAPSGYLPPLIIDVSVPAAASGFGTNLATVADGGGPSPSTDTDQILFSKQGAPFGIVTGSFIGDFYDAAYPFGAPSRLASDHPFEQRVDFDFNAKTGIGPDGTRYLTPSGTVRTVNVTLPRGMIGNPEAVPKCSQADFAEVGTSNSSTICPPDTQVGYLTIPIADGLSNHARDPVSRNPNSLVNRVALYNLEPPKGTPVDVGFTAAGFIQGHIYASLDAAHDYAIQAVTPNITSITAVKGAEATIWGVPADPAHDRFRFFVKDHGSSPALGSPWGSSPIHPWWTNPMDCGFQNGATRISVESYNHPGQFTVPEEASPAMDVSGCDDPRFRFEPAVALAPTDRHAGAPTGLDVHLEVPQRDDTVNDPTDLYATNGAVKAISTPPIKKAVITFPQGMTISPSAAQGLGSCTSRQIGIGNNDPVACPDNSQYGTITLHTPILPADAPMHGYIYIAKQGDNPFNNFLTLYFVVEDPSRGLRVKVPGKAELDPLTGQITTTFDDLPQFPISDFQLTFKGGVRAALVNPSTCGTKTIAAEFFSWADPGTPQTVKNSYAVTEKPDGSPCVNGLGDRSFAPQMTAGTLNSSAATFSPFAFRLTRSDDDQEFSQLALTLPAGLLGKLSGVAECSDAGIAQAISRTAAGDGALEQAQPSCPAASQVGTTQVGAGVGVPLTYVPGKAYLAGPYRGAPLSMVVITPLIVGPYDLGVIAVRSALSVDPDTTRVSVSSDPFPQIYQGIPVRIRDIRVDVDRPGFILNPTNCDPMSIDARITGTGADVVATADDRTADLHQRFQAADCSALPFKPSLSFRLRGGTHRGDHPAFFSRLRARPGDANIGAAIVALPHSEFLDNAHIGTVCTRVQFRADACPAASIYGHAKAISPLLDQPVEGDLVLRSSDHPLPDLVARLRGKIGANLVGRIDSVNGGIRSSFDSVPDVPVTEFTLSMSGGTKGLLVNSTNLCKGRHRADIKFTAQSGKLLHLRPLVRNSCKGKGKSRPGRHRHG